MQATSTKLADVTDSTALKSIAKPPSIVPKQKFLQLGNRPITDFITNAAEEVLLSVDDTQLWFDHLGAVLQNRKRGAAKVAATRQMMRQALTLLHSKSMPRTCAMTASAQPSGGTITSPLSTTLAVPLSDSCGTITVPSTTCAAVTLPPFKSTATTRATITPPFCGSSAGAVEDFCGTCEKDYNNYIGAGCSKQTLRGQKNSTIFHHAFL